MATGVCHRCARRAWLLARLAAQLDHAARDLTRLWSALELGETELIDALGGECRAELHDAWTSWTPEKERPAGAPAQVQSVCRHHCAYPKRLRADPLAPHSLRVRGGTERLHELLGQKVVAILGTRESSDYGARTALALARELAASGVTVASAEEGVGDAVRAGAAHAGGGALVLAAGCPDSAPHACGEETPRGGVPEGESHVSEIACGGRPRSWWRPADERVLALLADLVIIVEAGEHPWDRAGAQVAGSRGVRVAAVPGPIDSPTSCGSNALIAEGAPVVCRAQDALDALYGVSARGERRRRPRLRRPASESPAKAGPASTLDPAIAGVLERVGRGEDTLAKLCVGKPDCSELTLALTELELLGLLRRDQDGRYLLP